MLWFKILLTLVVDIPNDINLSLNACCLALIEVMLLNLVAGGCLCLLSFLVIAISIVHNYRINDSLLVIFLHRFTWLHDFGSRFIFFTRLHTLLFLIMLQFKCLSIHCFVSSVHSYGCSNINWCLYSMLLFMTHDQCYKLESFICVYIAWSFHVIWFWFCVLTFYSYLDHFMIFGFGFHLCLCLTIISLYLVLIFVFQHFIDVSWSFSWAMLQSIQQGYVRHHQKFKSKMCECEVWEKNNTSLVLGPSSHIGSDTQIKHGINHVPCLI